MDGALGSERSVGYLIQIAREARDREDFDTARVLLDEAAALSTSSPDVLHSFAQLAEVRGDYQQAERFWRQFIGSDPAPIWWALTSLGRCLYRQGNAAEAGAAFEQARLQNPLEQVVLLEHVKALKPSVFKSDCANAVATALGAAVAWSSTALWEIATAALSCQSIDDAIECARRLHATGDVRVSNEVLVTLRWTLSEIDPLRLADLDGLDLRTKALMMDFESLGGDYPGCEIGLIQRKFGAEPIGLLRWTTIKPAELIDALRCRFEGVGDPDQTELRAVETGDYKTSDRRFGMDMLTFVKTSSIDAETMHRKATTRIRFLRDKLLADLSSGEKVFVYRTYEDTLPMDDIVAIKEAMSAYGRNRLLYVRLSDSKHRPGTVEHFLDGLMIGRVARFSREPVKELFLDGWSDMFATAHGADNLIS